MSTKVPVPPPPWTVLDSFAKHRIICEFCDAQPGKACVEAKSRRGRSHVHNRRLQPVLAIWRAGRGAGHAQAWQEIATIAAEKSSLVRLPKKVASNG